jgi:hypothetical protein
MRWSVHSVTMQPNVSAFANASADKPASGSFFPFVPSSQRPYVPFFFRLLPLVRMTSPYQYAESFSVRFCVTKSL